jgi:trigger factor
LKIETQPRDDHQITLIVELEPEQLAGAKHRAARKISERKSVPGFRPGKAPYEVVVRSFGDGVVTEEAVDLLLDEVYPKALEETKLEPAAAGSLEKVEDLDKKPKFTFTVPLAPIVDLGDYRSIRLPYEWKEPDDDKTEESLEELRRMYAKTESVNRAIEKGDFVMIDLKGVEAKSPEGETPVIERPGTPVFIGDDKKPDEFPFEGFSKELIGLNANDSKSISHMFAKDYKDEKLQGRTINFEVKVKMVRGSILPELNDDFAKQVGPFENVQALRDTVKANLASQSKADYDDNFYAKILELIKAGATIKYPPQVLEHEVEHVVEDIKSRLAEKNMDLDTYLKTREMDQDKFTTEEARPAAVKRLERSLILDKIAKLEKLEISQEMLKSSFEQTWGEFQVDTTFKKAMRGKSQPPKQLMNAVAMESANRAYVQQTFNRLKEIATGQAPEISFGEAADISSKDKTINKSAKKVSAKSSPKVNKTSSIKTSHEKKTAPGSTKPGKTTKK